MYQKIYLKHSLYFIENTSFFNFFFCILIGYIINFTLIFTKKRQGDLIT